MTIGRTIRPALLWLALVLIVALAALSIVGAFLGADRAGAMFNAPPITGVWCLLLLVLLAGTAALSLRRRAWLAAVHLAAALILLGGMWGSPGGHRVRWRLSGTRRPRKGYMILHRGRPGSRLLAKIVVGDQAAYVPFDELPLTVELTDADIEYYSAAGGAVRDYLATLRVTPSGRPPVERTIEVNDPLHAGGYQFTLIELDADRGEVVLLVTSDDGLAMVYAGFALLVLGAFGQYWLVPLWDRLKGGRG
ncbi:MAG: hypothetical protein GVY16_08740 [Planctomycetes bacterium]|nr:cytochrome c biogenesis protein ResB [Phycisphaerae bacterium]NBB95814.1 hypothetical protein [Planctomycetota bacterium]